MAFVYADNGEHIHCLATEYSKVPTPSSSDMTSDNVSWRFEFITKMGFIVGVSESLRSIVNYVAFKSNNYSFLMVTQLLVCATGFINFLFLILGTVYRFDSTGKVCSGDYLDSGADTTGYLITQGAFLKYALILDWFLVALILLAVVYLIFHNLATNEP